MSTEGRWNRTPPARSRAARWVRGAGFLVALAFVHASASAAAPAEYSTAYSLNSCSGCHGGPPPALPPGSLIVPNGAAAVSGADLRQIMINRGTMGGILGGSPANGLTDTVLDTIWHYLIAVRDGSVAPAFGSSTNFGSAVVTATGSTQTFTITNERDVGATFAAGPSASGDFGVVAGGTCGAAIAATSSCTVKVRFNPSAIGVRNGSLTFTLDSPVGIVAQQVAIGLTGTGTKQFGINLTTLDFGSIVATTTLVRTALITNLGGASFTINTLSFSGGSAALYSLAPSNTCTPGLILAALAQCQLDVRFAPLVAGVGLNANLHITHTAVGTPAQDVTLLGAASPAPQGHIVLSALSLPFADTQLGSSTALSLTVQNDGTAPLNFSAFTFGGAAAADYSRSGSCNIGTPLAILATCTVTVTFQPTALGARSASLTIASDASNGPAAIALTGTGVPVPAPQASLLPATLDFGSQTIGGLFPSRSVVLKNVGTADMAVSAIAVTGASFSNVTVAACPATLIPGASCTIDIAFTPVAANTDYTGTLSVTDNAPGSPHTTALLGHGTAATVPVLTWAPLVTRLDFGLVTAGTLSAVQSVTLLNVGPGGVTLSVLNAVGADASAFSVTPGTCQLGQPLFQGNSCTIDVRFAPAFAGDRIASIQVASTGSAPPALALAGTGLAGPSPGLALSAAALVFDDTRVGASSVPIEVTIAGTGSGVVRVSALDITGPYSMQSKTCPSVPFVLQSGGACSITVTFQPQAEGAGTGILSVTSDALPPTNQVALSGTGESQPDVSGGGCSLASGDSLTDPTLWALMAMALAALWYRRRARRADRACRPGDRGRS